MAVEFKSGTMRWMLHVISVLAFPFRSISKTNSTESNMVLSHKFQSSHFFYIIRYPFKFLVAEKPKAIVQVDAKVDANEKRWKRILQLLRKGGVRRLGKRWVHCLTESAAIIIKKIFNLEQHKKDMTPKLLTGNSSSVRLKIPLHKKNCNKSAVVGYSMLNIVKHFPKRKTQCGFDKIKVHFSKAYTLFFILLFGNFNVLLQRKQKFIMINILCCGKHTLYNNTTLVSH